MAFKILLPHFRLAFANARQFDVFGLAGKPGGTNACVADLGLGGKWLDLRAREHFIATCGGRHTSQFKGLNKWISQRVDLLNRGFVDVGGHPTRITLGHRFLECLVTRNFEQGRYRLVYWFTDHLENSPLIRLTPREADVLHWLRDGKSNARIATILGMTPDTVKFHLKSIYRKLGVENRTAAATHDFQI